jgi:HipA-like protein
MMRQAKVFRNNELVGILIEENSSSYLFLYDDVWFADATKPNLSLSLPKTTKEFRSNYLFPFFFNMLSEGVNKQIQCRILKIDEHDYFGLLLATAQSDTLGAITIQPMKA